MNFPRFSRVLPSLAALSLAASLRAQEKVEPSQYGYTVTVELKVDEAGVPHKEQIVASEDPTPDHYLDFMALAMAAKTRFPPHMKKGKAVPVNVRAPFFFPIEGDEGPVANHVPKPKLKQASLPVYPPDMRSAGVVGGAVFNITVDATGKLTSVRTLRASSPEFEKSAAESLEKWEFAPAQENGKPVASNVNLAIVFDTQEDKADLKWRIPPRPMIGSFIVVRPDAAPSATAPAAEPGAPAPPATAPQTGSPATKPEPGK